MAFNRSKSLVRAQKLAQKGRYKDAIAEYQKILEGDPTDIRSLMKTGDLYAKINDVANAKRKYLKVAYQYSQDGFFLKAVAVYKQVLRLDPKAINLYSELAALYEELNLKGEAIKNYEHAAKAYEEVGDIKNSFDILRKIALINPEEIAYQLRLVEMYIQHGYKTEAQNYSQDIIKQIRVKGDEKKQMLIIQKLADLNLAEKEDICFLCELYLENSFYSKSLAELQKIFSEHGHDRAVLDLLALTFSKLNQVKKAKSIYNEIIRSLKKADPQHSDVEYYTRKLELIDEVNVADHSNSIASESVDDESQSSSEVDLNEDHIKSDEKLIEEVSTYFEYGLLEKAMNTIEKVIDSTDHPEEIKQKLLQVKDKYLNYDENEITSQEVKETTDVEAKNETETSLNDLDLTSDQKVDTAEFNFDEDIDSLNTDVEDNDSEELVSSFERSETPTVDPNQFSVDYNINQNNIEQEDLENLLFDEDDLLEKEITSELPIEEADQNDSFDLHEALEEEISKLDIELEDFAKTNHVKLYLEHDEVLAEFKKGVRNSIEPNDYETYYYLGIAYKEMNMIQDAIECFDISSKGERYFFRSKNMTASSYVQGKDFEKAVHIYIQCLKNIDVESPDYIGLNYELGKVYYKMQLKNEAKICFDKVHDKNPDYRSIEYYLESLNSDENHIENDLDELSVV